MRRKEIFSIILFLSLIFIVGCMGSSNNNSTNNNNNSNVTSGAITGYIYDVNDNPVANIGVICKSVSDVTTQSVKVYTVQRKTTNSSGYFEFTNLPDDEYVVETDQLEGKRAIKLNLAIANHNSLDINRMILKEPGSIKGKAVFNDKANHLGIDIFIPGTSFIAKTNVSGNYII